MNGKLRSTAVLCLTAGLLSAGPLAASPQGGAPERPQRVFQERVEVRVVNLEVVVEDRQGNRVTGLAPQDFRLKVDGKEVPIGYFSEVVDGKAAAAPAGEAGPQTVKSLPKAQPGQAVGTSYLVFIDDYFALKAHRDRVLDSLQKELAGLGPQDRMAVVAYDGKKLEMLTSWSGSAAHLQEVFRKAMERPSFARLAYQPLRDVDSAETNPPITSSGPGTPTFGQAGPTLAATENAVEQMQRRFQGASIAVTATLRSFANPPGRKVAILLSGGWPQSVRDWVAGTDTDAPDPEEREGGYLAPMFHTANLLGYTLYPVDLPGQSNFMEDAAAEGGDLAFFESNLNATGSPGLRRGPLREIQLHTALENLGYETGGKPLLDTARLETFEAVVADTRTYYWLGFTPGWKGDDANHEVKLDVLKPGLKARYRESFQDYSSGKQVDFAVESALLLGELPGSQPLEVEIGEMKKSRKKITLPLTLTFPLDPIALVPQGDRFVADLEVRIASVEENGNRSDLDKIPFSLSGTKLPPPGQFGQQTVTVTARNEKQKLVVTLHDPLSGSIFAKVLEVNP